MTDTRNCPKCGNELDFDYWWKLFCQKCDWKEGIKKNAQRKLLALIGNKLSKVFLIRQGWALMETCQSYHLPEQKGIRVIFP